MCMGLVFAQTEEEATKDTRPVYMPFESGQLIDQQTVYIPDHKTLEFVLEHRFGSIENGFEDMFGLYAPSNIRMGLNYSLTNDVMIGFGVTKTRKLTDFRLKWNVLKQTRSDNIPFTVSLYGNFGIDGRNAEVFGLDYRFQNRYSFFGQVIIGRKINEYISFQFAPSYTHINKVEPGLEHDKLALSFGGRYKFSSQSSIVFNLDLPLHIRGMQETKDPDFLPGANFSLGWEIATGTHVFQIFLAAYDNLSPQYNVMTNSNKFGGKTMLIGFNMTRLWNF